VVGRGRMAATSFIVLLVVDDRSVFAPIPCRRAGDSKDGFVALSPTSRDPRPALLLFCLTVMQLFVICVSAAVISCSSAEDAANLVRHLDPCRARRIGVVLTLVLASR